MTVIRPLVSLRGEPSSVHCSWFSAARRRISHTRDSVAPFRMASVRFWKILAWFKSLKLFFIWWNVLILPRLANYLYQHFRRCFEWEMQKPKGLNSLHLCGIFECSPQLEKCLGSASAELRGQKVFLLCQVEPCKICVTLCSCGSRVMFAFLGVVCAKLRLKVFVFLFHNQSLKGKEKKKEHAAQSISKMRGCTSRLQRSFRPG